MTFPPMRPQLELQLVHDLLMDVLSDQRLTEAVLEPELVRPLMLVADCLCWVLHHEHPGSHASYFAYLLACLKRDLAEMGHRWEPGPEAYIVEED